MSLGKLSLCLGLVGLVSLCFSCSSGGSSGATVAAPNPTVGLEIVAASNPAPGAIDVPVNTAVAVSFAVPMDPSTLTPATLALYHGGNQVAGQVSYSGLTATFTPDAPLTSNAPMRAVLASGVFTAAGARLTQELAWTFTTKDEIPIQVISTVPLPAQSAVGLLPKIAVHFSEDFAPGSVKPSSFQLVGPLGPVAGAFAVKGSNSWEFVPSAPLKEFTFYTATVSGITDVAGNAISPNYSWTFQTLDAGPPSIVSTTPIATNPMAKGIVQDIVIRVQFSEPMSPFSITPNTIKLIDAIGNTIAGAVGIDSLDPKSVIFTPNALLKDGRIFTATLDGSIADLAGNVLGPDFVWSFETVVLQHGVFELVENNDLGDANTPAVAYNPNTGQIVAVWRQQADVSQSANSGIYGSYFDPVKLVWSVPTLFSNVDLDANSPAVAWDLTTGDAVAVWVQQIDANDTKPRVYRIPFYTGANYWDTGDLVALSSSTGKASDPQIAYDELLGTFQVVWQESDATQTLNRSIQTCQLDPYSFPIPYNSNGAQILDAASGALSYYKNVCFGIDVKTGRGYAAWAEQDQVVVNEGSFYNLYARAYWSDPLFATVNWGTNSVLLESDTAGKNNSNNIETVEMVVDPLTQDGLFVWRQRLGIAQAGKAYRAFFQRLNFDPVTDVYSYPGCSSTTAPCMIQLDQDTTNAVVLPQIAVDASGNVMAVWAQSVPTSSTTMPGDGFISIYSVTFAPGGSVAGPIQLAENQSSVPCIAPALAVSGGTSGPGFFVTFVEQSVSGSLETVKLNSYANGTWGSTLFSLEPAPTTGNNSTSASLVLTSIGADVGLCVWERTRQGVASIVSNRFP